jgi:pyruvate/2-oxoglutarate dehydrogenase complex dihydrolipoamide acyltransferase (E2) component
LSKLKGEIMAVKILMPRLTDTMLQGVISDWIKNEGDEVREGDPLYAVETDKASVEVTSSATGILLKVLAKRGEAVEVGGTVAIIGERGEDFTSLLVSPPPLKRQEKEDLPRGAEEPSRRVLASPAAKRRAREANIDLKAVHGSGEGGLITEKDLLAHLEMNRASLPPSSQYGPEESIPLAGIARVMCERMTLSADIPQVTTVAETDASDLLELSSEKGISITTFVVRAVVEGLKLYPLMNSSLDGGNIIRKAYCNIGVSVATPRGLIVPVLHNAENKDISQLAKDFRELAAKARDTRLSLEDVSGATFTVTNSGVYGSLLFTPRITPPESAVLGMGKIMKQPVVRDDKIVIRSMIYLCLSYDHRHIDGETAVKFLQEVKKALQTPGILLL